MVITKTARHFADWQKEQIINKACEWLKEKVLYYTYSNDDEDVCISTDDLLEDFKKAMED